MSQQDPNSPAESPAEAYERYQVPIIFSEWTPELLGLVQIKPGESVLDVACATGIVARGAVEQAGSSGRVVGLDISAGMLEKARTLNSSIQWTEADAMDMPFSDGEFDVVVCQQGLQFMSDRLKAVQEMYRVLAPRGRMANVTWFSLEHIPGQFAIAQGLARHVSAEVAGLMQSSFSLGDAEEVRSLLEKAGFEEVMIREATKVARFPSVRDFVRIVAVGSVIGRSGVKLSDDTLEALIDDVSVTLRPYVDDEGLAYPMTANLASARK